MWIKLALKSCLKTENFIGIAGPIVSASYTEYNF